MINLKKQLDITFLGIVYFVTHLPLLGWDIINVDAPAWNYRATQFWSYLKNFNFLETYRTYHPGVTIMWLAGFGGEVNNYIHKIKYGVGAEYFNYLDFPWILFSNTLPLVLIDFLFILLFLKLLRYFFSPRSSFFMALILILEPFFLGNTRVLHLDGLWSLFGINSLLLFLIYLKNRNKKYLYLSGILLGLSLLTKITSFIIIPSIFLILTFYHLVKRSQFVVVLKSLLFDITIYCLSGFITFFVMFPSMWVNPIRVIRKIIFDGILKTGQGTQPNIFFNQPTDNPGVLFYPLQIIFRSSPLLIVLLFVGLFVWLSKKRKIKTIFSEKYLIYWGSALYFITYFIFMTISVKKIDRYIIPLFPVMAIYAGATLSKLFVNKTKLIVFAIISFYSIQILPIFPDFFAYYNPLAGGTQIAVNVLGLQDWATGYYRVTKYLNQFPNMETKVLATYNDASIRPIFKGKVVSLDKVSNLNVIDYALIFRGEERINEILKYMSLEKVFYIGSYDYFYLYKKNEE